MLIPIISRRSSILFWLTLKNVIYLQHNANPFTFCAFTANKTFTKSITITNLLATTARNQIKISS